MTKEQLYQEGLNYISLFCKVNNIKMPKIICYNDNGYYCCGCYDDNKKIIKIYLKSCANEINNPGYSWSHRHYFVDREPCGVICHEFGHYLHDILTNSKLVLPKENKITSYEPDFYERFAETIKLFILNPSLLKEYDQQRYKVLTQKLKLIPIINDDWETVMNKNNMNIKFILATKRKLKK